MDGNYRLVKLTAERWPPLVKRLSEICTEAGDESQLPWHLDANRAIRDTDGSFWLMEEDSIDVPDEETEYMVREWDPEVSPIEEFRLETVDWGYDGLMELFFVKETGEAWHVFPDRFSNGFSYE